VAIRLETAKGTGIRNYQERQIQSHLERINRILEQQHPRAKRRTTPSALYNCHGLTFASRRTQISSTRDISTILEDDAYSKVELKDAKPGDVVVYSDDRGDANHSGIIVDFVLLPMVCSKWGSGAEFVHDLYDCPKIYGPNITVYRCSK